MNLLVKNIAMITALCFCLPARAQEHHAHDVHDQHDHKEANSSHASHSGHAANDGPILTRTKDIEEKKAGKAAMARLVEILSESNNEFILQSHGVGKYGRCLGTLFIDDTNINVLLLEEGLADEYT